MHENELESLIRLLDDPDQHVFSAIRSKLNVLGSAVIPSLERAWENSLDELFQTRIEQIIHDIHQQEIEKELQEWMDAGARDLFTAAWLITRFQYPDTTKEDLRKSIDKIKRDVWLEINDHLTALEKIKIMNHIFFEVHQFNRSNNFQNSAQSNFLNNALEQKKGSPIALAILYAIIAQELEMPVYGVALPKNFILCYQNKSQIQVDDDFEDEVLFYVNPFNKGTVFGKKEIDYFIKQQKLEKKRAYFIPCTNRKTIAVLLQNLVAFYDRNAERDKVADYQNLLQIIRK